MRNQIIASLGMKVFQTLIGLLVSVVIARTLGPDGYGYFTFVIVISAFVAMVLQFGLPTILLRDVGVAYGQADQTMLRHALAKATTHLVIILKILIGAILALYFWYLIAGGNEWITQAALALIMGTCFCILRVNEAILLGVGKTVIAQVFEKIVLGLLVVTVWLSARQEFGTLSSLQAALIYSASLLVCAAAATLVTHREFKDVNRVAAWKKCRSRPYELKALLPFFLVSAVGMLSGQVDALILGTFGEQRDLGLYRVAFTWAAFLIFPMTALDAVFFPRIASLYRRQDLVELQRIAKISARLSLLIGLIVLTFFLLFGREIISLIYGKEYLPSYPLLLILAIGQLVNAAVGSPHGILNLTGRERLTLRLASISIASAVILGAIAVNLAGAIGIAVSTSIVIAGYNLALVVQLKKSTGIRSDAL